jgi:hypothetical protein
LPIVFVAWILCAGLATAEPVLGGNVSPDGKTTVQIDVPAAMRNKNLPGTDGGGLCVWASITHAAKYQSIAPLTDLLQQMTRKPGGGWPQRVDQELSARPVDYGQYEGQDLTVISAALLAGKLPSVTYNGHDPHYPNRSISHMVNCVCLTPQWAAVLDNNFIGANDIVWMTPQEFAQRWTGKGGGWAVVLFGPKANLPMPVVPQTSQLTRPRRPVGGDDDYDEYEWRWYPSAKDWLSLYCGTVKVGTYGLIDHKFRFYDHTEKRWMGKVDSPLPVPELKAGTPIVNGYAMFGKVRYAGLSLELFPQRVGADERWTRCGQKTTKEAFLAMLPALPPAPSPQPSPGPGPMPPAPSPVQSPEDEEAMPWVTLMLIMTTGAAGLKALRS